MTATGVSVQKKGTGAFSAAGAEKGDRSLFRREWATVAVLWRRDLMRLFRQKSRLVGALAQPLIFWLVIGSGMAGSFRAPGSEVGYLTYFFPGVVAMVVLFTSIFTTMSVIEDRHAGFLQSVLVAPSSRAALAAGKIAGGTTVALLQAGLFLALAPFAGFAWGGIAWGALAVVLTLTSLALTALGFALAWWIDDNQGYHAVMSVLLIPLWVLSGAMFPVAGARPWLAALMRANPLTYAVDGTRRALAGEPWRAADLAVIAVFALAMFGVAAVAAGAGPRRARKEKA